MSKVERIEFRKVDEIPVDEKVAKFDKLYKLALEIEEAKRNKKRDEDEDHWCFETVMELLCSPNQTTNELWSYLNKLANAY